MAVHDGRLSIKCKCITCDAIFTTMVVSGATVYCEKCGGRVVQLNGTDTMHAAVLQAQNSPLVIKELVIPQLNIGQVLVKIFASGICGAQINEVFGRNGEDRYLPHLLGHEGSGIVIKIGLAVKRVQVGDHVVMHWRKAPGIESIPPVYYDMEGNAIGAGWVTTFSTFSVVSENRLTPIDKNIPFDVAALMGCAVTTGLGLINNEALLKIGQTIAVCGCGGVGLNVIQGAVLAGASRIFAMDNKSDKLKLALEFGATDALLIDDSFDFLSSAQVDAFVECTGHPDIIASGLDMVKSGGRMVLVGQPDWAKDIIFANMRRHYCGKTILDSQGGMTQPEIDIPNYLNLYNSGRLSLEKLITHRFQLEEINDAMKVAYSGHAIRCILEMHNE